MARIGAKTETIYTIEMRRPQASWLMALMQNPLFDDETDEEELDRVALFTALKSQLIPDEDGVFASRSTGEDVPF